MKTGHAEHDTAAVCAVLEKMAGVKRGKAEAALVPQEIQHRGLGQHRFGNAVALRAGALLGGLGGLQIGAEMARALDDALADRQPRGLEARERRRDLAARRSAAASAAASSAALATPAATCGRATKAASPMIATRPNAMRGRFEIVDRLQDRLVDQSHDLAELRRAAIAPQPRASRRSPRAGSAAAGSRSCGSCRCASVSSCCSSVCSSAGRYQTTL